MQIDSDSESSSGSYQHTQETEDLPLKEYPSVEIDTVEEILKTTEIDPIANAPLEKPISHATHSVQCRCIVTPEHPMPLSTDLNLYQQFLWEKVQWNLERK